MTNYDMTKVLPHKPPMILIDDVLEYNLEERSVSAIVNINEDKLFFDKSINGVHSTVGIEFMAQTIGCYSYFRNDMKPPGIGFLLGSRLFNCNIPYFENGKTYNITAKEIFTDNKLVSFECLIYNDNEVCAQAVINAYMPANKIDLIGMLNG